MSAGRSDVIVLSDREKTDIATYARKALGLDYRSAEILFEGQNSLEDLQGMVQELKDRGTLVESDWDAGSGDEESYSECRNCLCCCECSYEDDEDDE